MSSARLHPTVIWGQRKEFIFMRIILQSCEVRICLRHRYMATSKCKLLLQKPDFLLTEDQIDFKGT